MDLFDDFLALEELANSSKDKTTALKILRRLDIIKNKIEKQEKLQNLEAFQNQKYFKNIED